MTKKIFCLIAVAITPLFADVAESPQIAEATHIQVMDKQLKEEGISVEFLKTKEALASLARNDELVLEQYDLFIESLQQYLNNKTFTEKDVKTILSGLLFAAEKHKSQNRKNPAKTPYIVHPIGVADSILRIGHVQDVNVIVAALLHDTMEDTNTTYEEITEKFGSVVSGYVKEVSDDKGLPTQARKKLQIIGAFHKSKGAAMIKLSDKLYNLNNLLQDPPSDWTRDRIDQYFQWAQSVIENLPPANDSLKDSVRATIAQYWEKQAKSTKTAK